MILVVLADLECPAEMWWGQIAERAGEGGGGGEAGEETVEDRKTTDLSAVRE